MQLEDGSIIHHSRKQEKENCFNYKKTEAKIYETKLTGVQYKVKS